MFGVTEDDQVCEVTHDNSGVSDVVEEEDGLLSKVHVVNDGPVGECRGRT